MSSTPKTRYVGSACHRGKTSPAPCQTSEFEPSDIANMDPTDISSFPSYEDISDVEMDFMPTCQLVSPPPGLDQEWQKFIDSLLAEDPAYVMVK